MWNICSGDVAFPLDYTAQVWVVVTVQSQWMQAHKVLTACDLAKVMIPAEKSVLVILDSGQQELLLDLSREYTLVSSHSDTSIIT